MDKFEADEMRNRLRHVKKYCEEHNSDARRKGCKNCPALDENCDCLFWFDPWKNPADWNF